MNNAVCSRRSQSIMEQHNHTTSVLQINVGSREDEATVTEFRLEDLQTLQVAEVDIGEPNEVAACQTSAFNRKRHITDPEQLFAVRKRLFCDTSDRPTQNVFYMEGERIDMTDASTCAIQRTMFARIFNSILAFSKCNFTEKNTMHRNLTWAVKLTESRVKKLMSNGYKDYHLSVAATVSYILRALEDVNYVRCDEMLFQLVPITCTIDKTLKERLDINSIEVRQVNSRKSLSVNLNFDVKFVYAGQFRVKTIPEQGDKYYVAPTPFMGNYLNEAVADLYNLIYDLTKKYIKKFFKRYPTDPVASPPTDVFDESSGRHTGLSKPSNNRELNELLALKFLLRSVGRDVNLKRIDIDKNNVFNLTSTMKTKPKYLNIRPDQTFAIDSTPNVDAEAVFLSSYTRARIMEDGSLNFQIYSRACLYMSDDEEFPECGGETDGDDRTAVPAETEVETK